MILPKPEKQGIPIGHYQFKLLAEPRLEPYGKKGGKKVVIVTRALGPTGSFKFTDSFLHFEDRYGDFCKAIGAEENTDADYRGSIFDGDIEYIPWRSDPTRKSPKIVNIKAPSDTPQPTDEEPNDGPEDMSNEDDIPFS